MGTYAQTIYWDFETATPTTNTASGVSVSEITHGNNHGNTTILSATSPSSGYSDASGNNNAAATAWTGGFNTGGSTYYEFTLTPEPGNILTLYGISFGARSTTTGPISYTLRSNLDSYTSDISTGTFLNNSIWELFSHTSLAVSGNIGTAITFRLYGYNGSGTNPPSGVANWRIDDLTLMVGVIAEGPLPVQLNSLKAIQTSAGINLQWSNFTETDIAEYNVERSSTGKDFNLVSRLAPLKNNGDKADYQLLDPSPLQGNSFYRIKAVEQSGRIVYSDVIRMNLGKVNTVLLSLYPNPVNKNHFVLQMDNLPSGNYQIRIYNSSAQVMNAQTLNHSGGSLSQTVQLNNLPSGIYLLEIRGSIKACKQFVIQ